MADMNLPKAKEIISSIKEMGYSQYYIAKHAGLTQSCITKLLHKENPRTEALTLQKLVRLQNELRRQHREKM